MTSRYSISFWLADDVGDNHFDVKFGGSTLLTETTTAIGYELLTVTGRATGSSTALTFDGQYLNPGAGVGSVIDDVSVSDTVPEPATLTLTALGLAGVVRRARRRRAAR